MHLSLKGLDSWDFLWWSKGLLKHLGYIFNVLTKPFVLDFATQSWKWMWLTRFNACWETRVETSESRLVLTPSLRVSGRTPTMELFTSCHQASQWSSQDPSKCRVDNKQRLDNEHRTHLCDTSLYCDLQYFRFFFGS